MYDNQLKNQNGVYSMTSGQKNAAEMQRTNSKGRLTDDGQQKGSKVILKQISSSVPHTSIFNDTAEPSSRSRSKTRSDFANSMKQSKDTKKYI